ncbi:hypothetical protein WME94_30650 [Sorangium sp. So ce429]
MLELNALDVEERTVDHKLAYQIDTLEEGEGEPYTSMRYLVDARSGEILAARSLSSSVVGTGKSFKSNGPANDVPENARTLTLARAWLGEGAAGV